MRVLGGVHAVPPVSAESSLRGVELSSTGPLGGKVMPAVGVPELWRTRLA